MTSVAEYLRVKVEREGLCPGASSFDDWLNLRWIRVPFGRFTVPVLPTIGLRQGLMAHDIHHALTGYDTSLAGEAQLAAWEMASGGCGLNVFFWVDRIVFLIVGFALMPRRMTAAFRRGSGARNLYRIGRATLLSRSIEELAARTNVVLPTRES